MEVVSPYGKNVADELRRVYRLESVDALLERVGHFLAESYGFRSATVEHIHVAFGIAVRFAYQNQRYYLKFTGRANHQRPEALFSYQGRLRHLGVPLPEVLRTLDGTYFETILDSPWYDVTYVMKAVPGQVMRRKTARRLEQYVRVMAQVHRLGADYKPRIVANSQNLNDFFREAVESLAAFTLRKDDRRLLERVKRSVQTAVGRLEHRNDLSKTHIHGDFRLCHVMFDQSGVSGVIDAEQITYAERLWEVCVGLVSHPNPARCLLLELGEVLELLKLYDGLLPFTEADRQASKGVLQLALLNELSGALQFLETGYSDTRPQDARRVWHALEQVDALPNIL